MRARPFTVSTLVAGLLAARPPAYAHHGASMFDMRSSITVRGTVTSFEWSNPPAMIFLDAQDDKGKVQKWNVEIRGGPNVLTKAGGKELDPDPHSWFRDAQPGGRVLRFRANLRRKSRWIKLLRANHPRLNLDI